MSDGTAAEAGAEARAAAAWWADRLRSPGVMNAGSRQERELGARDENLEFAEVLATTLAHTAAAERDPDSVDRFEGVLAGKIDEALRAAGPYGITLGTDYHPDLILGDAAEETGVSGDGMTTFPWKTRMRVEPGRVQVAAGYGAGWVDLELDGEGAGRG